MKIVEENCSVCGEGQPLSRGVYGEPGARVRWAMWTCGHLWTSGAGDVAEPGGHRLRRVLASAGLRFHAPLQ